MEDRVYLTYDVSDESVIFLCSACPELRRIAFTLPEARKVGQAHRLKEHNDSKTTTNVIRD